MNTMFRTLFIPFCCIPIIFGCSGSRMTNGKVRIQSIDKNAIVIGKGGGFTGSSSGFILTRSGDAYSWSTAPGIGQPDTLQPLFHIDDDSVAFFFRYLDEIRFSSSSYSSSGNMTAFIEARSPNTTHRVQWDDDSHSVPPELPVFYSLLGNFILRH